MKGRAQAGLRRPDNLSGLSDDALASEFVRQYGDIGKRIVNLRPLHVELRRRFFVLRPGKSILGCKTWTQFCEKRLHYTDRHVRRLIAGDNPATEKHSAKTPPLPTPTLGLPDAPPAESLDWTDNHYITTCVNVLRPLASDSRRLRSVLQAIGEELGL